MEMTDPKMREIDKAATDWLALRGIALLRISLGIVFLWFGVLKFFPALSAAEDLATRTIETLTLGLVTPAIALPLLAVWEVLIGAGLLSGKWMRATIILLLLQMAGTVTPLFLFPGETWLMFPLSPTLEGQYIIKNIVLVTAALVIGATVRGGALVADPKIAKAYQVKAERESA